MQFFSTFDARVVNYDLLIIFATSLFFINKITLVNYLESKGHDTIIEILTKGGMWYLLGFKPPLLSTLFKTFHEGVKLRIEPKTFGLLGKLCPLRP